MTTEPPESERAQARFSWKRLLGAALGGTLVAFSLPPWGLWPLAFVGVVIFERRQGANPDPPPGGNARVRVRAAVDGDRHVLDVVPHGAGVHRPSRSCSPASTLRPRRSRRVGPWRTVGRPAAHTLVEAIRLGFPFGGVPLATLGISQAGGPLLGVARVGGVMLLTWIVFQVGCALAGPAPAVPKMMPGGIVGRERAARARSSRPAARR